MLWPIHVPLATVLCHLVAGGGGGGGGGSGGGGGGEIDGPLVTVQGFVPWFSRPLADVYTNSSSDSGTKGATCGQSVKTRWQLW